MMGDMIIDLHVHVEYYITCNHINLDLALEVPLRIGEVGALYKSKMYINIYKNNCIAAM